MWSVHEVEDDNFSHDFPARATMPTTASPKFTTSLIVAPSRRALSRQQSRATATSDPAPVLGSPLSLSSDKDHISEEELPGEAEPPVEPPPLSSQRRISTPAFVQPSPVTTAASDRPHTTPLSIGRSARIADTAATPPLSPVPSVAWSVHSKTLHTRTHDRLLLEPPKTGHRDNHTNNNPTGPDSEDPRHAITCGRYRLGGEKHDTVFVFVSGSYLREAPRDSLGFADVLNRLGSCCYCSALVLTNRRLLRLQLGAGASGYLLSSGF